MAAPRSYPTVRREVLRADRGMRPAARGWFHFGAALVSLVLGSILSTFAWMRLDHGKAAGVIIYAIGVFVLFGVSAAYHRGPWSSAVVVDWWRRADHATIAVFIAATYTPLCLIVLQGAAGLILLAIAWAGALGAVALNLIWIDHPRWMAVVIYLVLGWLVVPLVPTLWSTAGANVVWLLLTGGVVYSLGALVYGLQWPGRNARWYGFHEHFHTATIIAAAIHLVAIWMVVVGAQTA